MNRLSLIRNQFEIYFAFRHRTASWYQVLKYYVLCGIVIHLVPRLMLISSLSVFSRLTNNSGGPLIVSPRIIWDCLQWLILFSRQQAIQSPLPPAMYFGFLISMIKYVLHPFSVWSGTSSNVMIQLRPSWVRMCNDYNSKWRPRWFFFFISLLWFSFSPQPPVIIVHCNFNLFWYRHLDIAIWSRHCTTWRIWFGMFVGTHSTNLVLWWNSAPPLQEYIDVELLVFLPLIPISSSLNAWWIQ